MRLIIALALTTLALLGLAAPAQAGSPADEEGATKCALVKPTDDDTISILGRICDRREQPPVAVPGVSVTVEDADGNVIGEATSSEDGTFVIDLPGTSIEHLGKSYKVILDESTLPEGTKPDITSRTLDINIDNDQTVIFPIGDAGPSAPSKGVEALQLVVGRLVFSVLLAMAALGLSMVFGTTGLTNFAHGELVTFGALAAFFLDQLPGEIEIGGTDITVILAVLAAFLAGGVFGWLNDAALWRPLRHRGTGLVAMMIVSIGLSIFLRNVFQYFAGAQTRNYSQYGGVEPWEIGQILLTPKELVVILTGLSRCWSSPRACCSSPASEGHPGGLRQPGPGRRHRHQRRAGDHDRLDRRCRARRSRRRAAGRDPGLRLPARLPDPAARVRRRRARWPGHDLGRHRRRVRHRHLHGAVDARSSIAEFKFVGALLLLIIILLIRPQGLLGRAQRIG